MIFPSFFYCQGTAFLLAYLYHEEKLPPYKYIFRDLIINQICRSVVIFFLQSLKRDMSDECCDPYSDNQQNSLESVSAYSSILWRDVLSDPAVTSKILHPDISVQFYQFL